MTEEPEATEQQLTGKEVTEEMIRKRAHEISEQEGTGTPEENWRRAEQELRGELGTGGEPSQP